MSDTRYIGVFDNEEIFDNAVQKLKESKIEIEEIFMPFPVHRAAKNVAGGSSLPVAAYFFGLIGMISVLAFLYYTAVISWPLNFGGKPSNAFPSFIIVTLVLTIFTVTILSLTAFLFSAKLYPGKKAVIFDNRAMDDKFIIVLKSEHVPDAENLLKQQGANEVYNLSMENIEEKLP
jgi:hypothetical protein